MAKTKAFEIAELIRVFKYNTSTDEIETTKKLMTDIYCSLENRNIDELIDTFYDPIIGYTPSWKRLRHIR